jgi:type II secretory pathway component PulF
MMTLLQMFFIRLSFDTEARKKLWKKFSVNAKYGISHYIILEHLLRRAREKKRGIAFLYEKMLRSRDYGVKLATALTGFVPAEEIQLILAGEEGNAHSENFMLASQLAANKTQIKKSVISACGYPFFLLTLSILLLLLISIQIIPQFAETLPPERWEGAAAYLYKVASFVNSAAGLFTGLILLGMCLAIYLSFPRWTGHWRKKIDSFGPWGVYRLIVGSSWLFSFATLMRAGIQINSILTRMMSSPDCTPYLRERLAAILHHYNHGIGFGPSLLACEMNFPSEETVDDIQAYAGLPNFEFQLFEIAQDRMEGDIEQIQFQMKKINMALMFFVALEIGALIAAVFSIQQQMLSM